MSIWKQIIAVAVICGAAYIGWTQFEAFTPDAAPATGTDAASVEDQRGGGRRGGRGFRGSRQGGAVVTAEVTEAEAGSRLVAIGSAEAAKSVTLYSQTAGIVAEVAFRPGDRVAAGDTLVRLDDAEQRIAVEQARVDVESAETTFQRYERLRDSPAYSEVQAQEARVVLARARNDLKSAELALARRTLTAPFDGVMGFAQIEIGDRISDTTPIANIDDRSTVFVSFQVPERYAALLTLGEELAATTAAYGAEAFDGRIDATDSRVDTDSRTLRVRAALPNEDDRLRPGMAFSVTLQFDTPGRPAVPQVAVQWDRDGAYVWKVVDGKAKRTEVQVIARTVDAVLVEGDIAPRDVVVAEGLEGLRDGADVVAAAHQAQRAARL